MKKLLILGGSILILSSATLYLYSKMFGAVAFFVLSALFYWLAWRETKKAAGIYKKQG
ncbi:hypothetical protein [Jeotgalibacillus sp. R-1-5s-1]|uniref:hypothetical protein n=1 Tax=Jeotgalibacillus sp. R-1-5s-1 TaxID=2555897 RepID=UPI00141B9796|nr:hypothetical protein [Jeotgalibacillus sp. R-1-5s-1]